MTTPTSPLTLLVLSKVQITATLDGQSLAFRHGLKLLSEFDDGLEIFLESPSPVRLEIPDFEDASGHWTVSAKTIDGSALGVPWDRGDGICHSTWGATEGEVKVDVTATNAAGISKSKPLFIKVRPESARPW